MSKIRIIPSLLVKNNRLVKGIEFQNHKDAGDPVTTSVALESQLADEICIIDLDAYEKKIEPNVDILTKIASKVYTPITFGGNISKINDVKKIITSGADKVLINYHSDANDLINRCLAKKLKVKVFKIHDDLWQDLGTYQKYIKYLNL